MTKRLSQSNAFGTAIGSCVPDRKTLIKESTTNIRLFILSAHSIAGCGVCVNMTTSGGVIQSMNFPDEYPPNLNCVFTIQSPSYTTITLSFTTFVVENCCDFVSVRNNTPPTFSKSIGDCLNKNRYCTGFRRDH